MYTLVDRPPQWLRPFAPVAIVGVVLLVQFGPGCTKRAQTAEDAAIAGAAEVAPATADTAAATDAATATGLADAPSAAVAPLKATLPLVLIADAPLPGGTTRFDYMDVDAAQGHLIVAHMNDGVLLVLSLKDGSVAQQLPGIPTVRGVSVANDVGRIFATSAPNQLVIVDNQKLTEIARVKTGKAPDGVGWDPVDKVVGVSDQGDGAISLIADSGNGKRVQTVLGSETGNVVYDASRGVFWITVVAKKPPDQLIAVDPKTALVVTTLDVPGCDGAHGLRLHPDGLSALIACEGNDKLARLELDGAHAVSIAATGGGPDVLATDPALGWMYVAAESGDVTVVDLTKPGLVVVGTDHPGNNAHTVAVDAATHRVFFPLMVGPAGKPVLRIMRPGGI